MPRHLMRREKPRHDRVIEIEQRSKGPEEDVCQEIRDKCIAVIE